ncbi:MAG: Zn-ribbon domain-containing OB-fold protein [Sporichthyaceae bacterium]
MPETTQGVAVAVELFSFDAGGPALVGSRCAGCDSYYFPKALSCRNPACEDKRVSDALMGRQGVLYSFTIQGYQPPPLFRMDPWEPYALALIELPEGIRVLGMLTGVDLADVQIGMPLRLVVEPLHRDESGREVLTYKYAPLLEGSAA